MSAVRTGPARRRGSLLRSRARVARLRWRLRQRGGGVGAAVLLRGDASPLAGRSPERVGRQHAKMHLKCLLYPQLLSTSTKAAALRVEPRRGVGGAMGTLGGFVAR